MDLKKIVWIFKMGDCVIKKLRSKIFFELYCYDVALK